MMKKIAVIGLVLLTFSCNKPDNTINYVLDNFTNGAILRTISSSGEFNFYAPNESIFNLTIEEHDIQKGALMKNVEVFLSFNQGTEINYKTLSPSEFQKGPTGLPRTDLAISLAEASSKLGISSNQYSGGDIIDIRLKLNLTDGRSFSTENVTGSLTGSYFKSPYKYSKIIKCIPLGAIAGIYTINMLDSYGDGWNGATLSVTVDGVKQIFTVSEDQGATNTEVVTIPESASTMSIEFSKGDWDSEVSYTINYTKLDGSGAQVAIGDGPSPAVGEKTLSICQ